MDGYNRMDIKKEGRGYGGISEAEPVGSPN